VTADRDITKLHVPGLTRVPPPETWDGQLLSVSGLVLQSWWADSRGSTGPDGEWGNHGRVPFDPVRAKLDKRGQPSIFQWADLALRVTATQFAVGRVQVPRDLRREPLDPGTTLHFRARAVVRKIPVPDGSRWERQQDYDAPLKLRYPTTNATTRKREEARQEAIAQYREYREMYDDGLGDEPRSWYR
jgi:hypothetical protein